MIDIRLSLDVHYYGVGKTIIGRSINHYSYYFNSLYICKRYSLVNGMEYLESDGLFFLMKQLVEYIEPAQNIS